MIAFLGRWRCTLCLLAATIGAEIILIFRSIGS